MMSSAQPSFSVALVADVRKESLTFAGVNAEQMKIGVIVAMDKELAQLSQVLGGDEGTIGSHDVVVARCGIGKVNAAVGTVQMIERHSPDLIVSTGVAGGADVTMSVTDVVVGTEYRYHDAYCGSDCQAGQIMGLPAAFSAPSSLVERAVAVGHGQTTVHPGLIVTGDWFVDTPAKMQTILSTFPAAKAVDMESCAIAQVCYLHDVPFVSFRIISDIPLKENNTAQYFDFWERIARGSFAVTKRFLEQI